MKTPAIKRFNDDGSPILPPNQHVVGGSCGKCGAPYFLFTGPWMGVIPPEPRPSCCCWNRLVALTTGTTTEMPLPDAPKEEK